MIAQLPNAKVTRYTTLKLSEFAVWYTVVAVASKFGLASEKAERSPALTEAMISATIVAGIPKYIDVASVAKAYRILPKTPFARPISQASRVSGAAIIEVNSICLAKELAKDISATARLFALALAAAIVATHTVMAVVDVTIYHLCCPTIAHSTPARGVPMNVPLSMTHESQPISIVFDV
jgi:hypothetical protein